MNLKKEKSVLAPSITILLKRKTNRTTKMANKETIKITNKKTTKITNKKTTKIINKETRPTDSFFVLIEI